MFLQWAGGAKVCNLLAGQRHVQGAEKEHGGVLRGRECREKDRGVGEDRPHTHTLSDAAPAGRW